MFDNPELFWKNFRLGTELQISGTFIYNSLYCFDQMDHFYFEQEIFEFLYNASVGLERLEKISLILLEHDGKTPQDEYEKTLITHSHAELLKRIKKRRKLNLTKSQNNFLQLLTNFYKSFRYERFNLSSVFSPNKERKRFIEFIEEELKIKIIIDLPFSTPNNDRIKAFIGKTIGKLALQLYEIIKSEADRLNIYTYEIISNSKAYKIFITETFTFERENLLKKEILNYLFNVKNDKYLAFVKQIDPLPFESNGMSQYVGYLINPTKNLEILDELDYIYEEHKIKKSRIESVKQIGESLFFDDEEEDL